MSLANDLSSFAATIVRLGRGVYPAITADRRPDPKQLLELYDFEGCPYCRKVREVLCELDLDYLVHPVAQGSPRRQELKQLGGKVQVPYLIDPNTHTRLYESDDIIRYLFEHYGAGPVPMSLRLGPVTDVTSMLASAWRPAFGARYVPAKRPEKPLELFSFEASPFSRIVRERLCALEIPYVLHNVAKGSPSRDAFVKRSGKMMVPYLIDPNTGTEMFESADIVRYLDRTYAREEA